jgi:dienelactone hydrolase
MSCMKITVVRYLYLGLALIAMMLSGCVTDATIPTYSVDAHPGSEPKRLDYKLARPKGPGPFPAVVLLHGCSGWHGGNISDWSEWFVERGYVALAVDSFGTRGVAQDCVPGNPARRLGKIDRMGDAFGGFHHLTARKFVDPDRIIAMGFSQGGGVTIGVIQKAVLSYFFDDESPRFAAGIAVYPYCGHSAGFGVEPSAAPLLIIGGDQDDWTPPDGCVRWKAEQHPDNDHVEVHVIPGATHGFDSFTWNGIAVGPRHYLGYYLEPSGTAVTEAARLIHAFLAKHL